MKACNLWNLIFLSSFAALTPRQLSAQEYRKVLIIDTLITQARDFNVIVRSTIDSSKLGDYAFMDSLERRVRIRMGYIETPYRLSPHIGSSPNAALQIHATSTTDELCLPLDDSGGLLNLKGAFSLKNDTIRINRHTVYHNCLADTLTTYIGWFRDFNSDTSRPLKLIKENTYPAKAILKECDAPFPCKSHCVINNRTHFYTISAHGNIYSVTWSHGHKKMPRRCEKRYEYRKLKGKPYTYFAQSTRRCRYSLHAEIDLQNSIN